ncbi:hypothetical protein C8R43DRAFT_1118642 [Mycena crocata]|nr:hypothetical protein C8R43DRAFT_1118642 [Mycena crocata]
MSSEPKMSLQGLNVDVLIAILSLTDVATIAAFSGAVRHLAGQGRIDAPPDEMLQTLSITKLIDEVKRTMLGPRTWSPFSADPPTLLRRSIVPLHNVLGKDAEPVELLPGGRYIIYVEPVPDRHCGKSIACWDVWTGLCVWSWGRSDYSVAGVAFDIRSGSKAIVAFMCLYNSHCGLVVLEANLATGQSTQLLEPDFPSYEALGNSLFFLVNWRTGDYIVLDRDADVDENANSEEDDEEGAAGSLFPIFALLPGCPHIDIYLPLDRLDTATIHSFPSLTSLGRPIDSFHSDDHTAMQGTLRPPGHYADGSLDARVSESPLHDGVYKLVLELDGSSTMVYNLDSRSTLNSAPLKCVSSHSGLWDAISAAGYSVAYRPGSSLKELLVYPPRGQPLRMTLLDAEDIQRVHLTQSGIVLAISPSSVIVSYYL